MFGIVLLVRRGDNKPLHKESEPTRDGLVIAPRPKPPLTAPVLEPEAPTRDGLVIAPRPKPPPTPPVLEPEATPPSGVAITPRPKPPPPAPKLESRAPKEEFQPLFNGKDLTGWKPHPKQPGNWHVANGVLIGSGPALSHLYTERGDFTDFHLRVEARFNEGGSSGVYLRCPFGPSLPRRTIPSGPMDSRPRSTMHESFANSTGGLYPGRG